LQELERNFPGLEAIDILNAIKHPPRARKAEPEISKWSENFFKVHMFGRIIDDLMLGIPSLFLARDHKLIGNQSLESKDLIKLGQSMRNDLAYRRPTDDTVTQFGIQWVGSNVWFYGMKRAYGRFFVMVELTEHDAEQNPYETIISTLALRSLVAIEIKQETSEEIERAKEDIHFPSQDKTNSEGGAEQNTPDTTTTSLSSNKSTENNTHFQYEYFLCGEDEALRCPPDPTFHILPYNYHGNYEVQKQIAMQPGYADIFLAKCKDNGKTVVLKRLWEHEALEQSEVIF
jgi:hypothetical protein